MADTVQLARRVGQPGFDDLQARLPAGAVGSGLRRQRLRQRGAFAAAEPADQRHQFGQLRQLVAQAPRVGPLAPVQLAAQRVPAKVGQTAQALQQLPDALEVGLVDEPGGAERGVDLANRLRAADRRLQVDQPVEVPQQRPQQLFCNRFGAGAQRRQAEFAASQPQRRHRVGIAEVGVGRRQFAAKQRRAPALQVGQPPVANAHAVDQRRQPQRAWQRRQPVKRCVVPGRGVGQRIGIDRGAGVVASQRMARQLRFGWHVARCQSSRTGAGSCAASAGSDGSSAKPARQRCSRSA